MLIDGECHARITGFGMATFFGDSIHENATGSPRWMAPELISIENTEASGRSSATDVYALACIAYEVS